METKPKCPSCKENINPEEIQAVMMPKNNLGKGFFAVLGQNFSKFNQAMFLCPKCNTILGISNMPFIRG